MKTKTNKQANTQVRNKTHDKLASQDAHQNSSNRYLAKNYYIMLNY